jgi:hypothetical protein
MPQHLQYTIETQCAQAWRAPESFEAFKLVSEKQIYFI